MKLTNEEVEELKRVATSCHPGYYVWNDEASLVENIKAAFDKNETTVYEDYTADYGDYYYSAADYGYECSECGHEGY